MLPGSRPSPRLWPLRGYGGRHEWSPHRLKPKIFAFRPPAEKACQVFSRTAPISNDPQQHCHKSCKGFGVLTSQPRGFDNIFNHRPVPRTAPDTRDITAGRAGATPPSRSFQRAAGTARCPGGRRTALQPRTRIHRLRGRHRAGALAGLKGSVSGDSEPERRTERSEGRKRGWVRRVHSRSTTAGPLRFPKAARIQLGLAGLRERRRGAQGQQQRPCQAQRAPLAP